MNVKGWSIPESHGAILAVGCGMKDFMSSSQGPKPLRAFSGKTIISAFWKVKINVKL